MSAELDENEGAHREAGQESWFTIMHRNGPEPGPFEKNGWKEYQKGFGSKDGNFWWGLENLHQRTSTGKWNVMFNLRVKGGSAVIKYHGFSVASSKDKYRVSLGKKYQFVGIPKLEPYIETIQGINNKMFSTIDSDNDIHGWHDLAKSYHGGFWFNGIRLFPPTGNQFTDALMAISHA